MKILVTGFDPFGEESVNPAIESVKKLPKTINGAEIITLEIPTVIKKSLAKIQEAILAHNPAVILSIGQAGGRSEITVERIGINVDDYKIPDNEGNQPIDEPIAKDGPAAYFVNLPIKAMVANIQAGKIPSSISNTAGTFICNHVTYGVQHLIATKYPGKRAGFIHIPYLPEQVIDKQGMPSMSLDIIVDGLVYAIEAIVDNETDLKVTGGAIH